MTFNQIKKQAENAFSNSNHSSILDDGTYQSLAPSEKEAFLHFYFKNPDYESEPFEERLAIKYPTVFVRAVRTNRVFLKKGKIEFLLALPFPAELKIHQFVWGKLQKEELFLWQKIELEKDSLPELSIEDVLYYTVFWIEENRFAENSKQDLQSLSDVYGFFIQYYLSTLQGEAVISKSDLFLDRTIGKENPLANLLNAIRNWQAFNDSILSEYCFDLDVNPEVQNGIIYFNKSPKAYYQWKLDGARYELNRVNYFLEATEVADYLESTGQLKIPKGRFPEDEAINRDCTIKRFQVLNFLSDLKIRSFNYHGNQIPIDSLLTPLLIYSTNRLYQYEYILDNCKAESSTWIEAFSKLEVISKHIDVENEPWLLMPIEEYLELNKKVLEGLSIEGKDELIQLFSFQVRPNPFDRFKKGYDVWKKPFLRIGDLLICPMAFFANNDWFYAFAQAGIENINRRANRGEMRKTADQMEVSLTDILKEYGLKAIHVGQVEQEGDVDIIVEDENHTLFIQLKRTYFRLDLKDQHNELVMVDNNAVKQLNGAEQFWAEKNEIYSRKKKPAKWIVTTSFEGVGKIIGECRKVNFFELVRVLKNYRPKTVGQLIEYIEGDKILKDTYEHLCKKNVPDELKMRIYDTGLPVPLDEPKAYRKAIFIENNANAQNIEIFQEALELDRNGKKEKSIKLFEKYLEISPSDVDALSAIANVHADIGDYKNAFLYFKKALKIIPLEPFIAKNYFIALLQGRKFYEGFRFMLQLLESYPFLGDFRQLYKDTFTVCCPALTGQQIEHLKHRWNKLN